MARALIDKYKLGDSIDWLTAYTLDLEQEPSCERRKEAVENLRALNNPKAIQRPRARGRATQLEEERVPAARRACRHRCVVAGTRSDSRPAGLGRAGSAPPARARERSGSAALGRGARHRGRSGELARGGRRRLRGRSRRRALDRHHRRRRCRCRHARSPTREPEHALLVRDRARGSRGGGAARRTSARSSTRYADRGRAARRSKARRRSTQLPEHRSLDRSRASSRWARARGPVWAAWLDGAPASFAYAPWRSAAWFDVSVDTLPGARQLGLGDDRRRCDDPRRARARPRAGVGREREQRGVAAAREPARLRADRTSCGYARRDRSRSCSSC